MTPETAFKRFETTVNADPDQLTEARLRRDAFVKALNSEEIVERAQAIGSLARKTQKAPLNDVDILMVYDASERPDWGSDAINGTSAEALEETATRIKNLLGPGGSKVHLLNTDGSDDLTVRLVHRKRHSVKCFLDQAGEEDAFTVDVVPAINHPYVGLWISERNIDDQDAGTWIRSNPEYLIQAVKDRQGRWDHWIPSVRALKFWNDESKAGMTSLYIEILALSALPTNEFRPQALQRFFQSAEWEVSADLSDPAGLCGAIQSDLDVDHARECLAEAAEHAREAVIAEADSRADDAVCAWRAIFGTEFPEPPSGCNGMVTAAVTAGVATTTVAARPRPEPRRVKDSPQG